MPLLLAAAAACDDPFEVRWESSPDTAVLYSLARPELTLPAAFNFFFRVPISVETPGATGQWDVALDTQAGQLVFLPPRALGINSRARIAPLPGVAFHDALEAPLDTAAYVSNRAVPVAQNTTYVIQTSEQVGAFGQRCVFYAKLAPLLIDPQAGTLRFLYDTNPVCNDTRLVPPQND